MPRSSTMVMEWICLHCWYRLYAIYHFCPFFCLVVISQLFARTNDAWYSSRCFWIDIYALHTQYTSNTFLYYTHYPLLTLVELIRWLIQRKLHYWALPFDGINDVQFFYGNFSIFLLETFKHQEWQKNSLFSLLFNWQYDLFITNSWIADFRTCGKDLANIYDFKSWEM